MKKKLPSQLQIMQSIRKGVLMPSRTHAQRGKGSYNRCREKRDWRKGGRTLQFPFCPPMRVGADELERAKQKT
jgi:hypothetical protein